MPTTLYHIFIISLYRHGNKVYAMCIYFGDFFTFLKPSGISVKIVVSLRSVKHVNIGQHKKSSNFSLCLKCCILRASLLYNIVLWLAIFDNISNAPLRCICVYTQFKSVIYHCYILVFIKSKSKLFIICLVWVIRIVIKRHNILFQIVYQFIYLRRYVNKNAETMLKV